MITALFLFVRSAIAGDIEGEREGYLPDYEPLLYEREEMMVTLTDMARIFFAIAEVHPITNCSPVLKPDRREIRRGKDVFFPEKRSGCVSADAVRGLEYALTWGADPRRFSVMIWYPSPDGRDPCGVRECRRVYYEAEVRPDGSVSTPVFLRLEFFPSAEDTS